MRDRLDRIRSYIDDNSRRLPPSEYRRFCALHGQLLVQAARIAQIYAALQGSENTDLDRALADVLADMGPQR